MFFACTGVSGFGVSVVEAEVPFGCCTFAGRFVIGAAVPFVVSA